MFEVGDKFLIHRLSNGFNLSVLIVSVIVVVFIGSWEKEGFNALLNRKSVFDEQRMILVEGRNLGFSANQLFKILSECFISKGVVLTLAVS